VSRGKCPTPGSVTHGFVLFIDVFFLAFLWCVSAYSTLCTF